MDRYEQRLKIAEAALQTLFEVVGVENVSEIRRDAAIQRFECSFEAVWKAARTYLFEIEGVDVASPKKVLRQSRNLGLLSDEQTALGLQMVDDRNSTSHTYNAGLAERIYERLKDYSNLMQVWLNSLQNSM